MEFEEMKKIWDSQNKEPFYGINENALHNRILSKKKQAHHITNTNEVLLIIVNTATGCLIFGMNFFRQSGSIFMYILAAWMFSAALYVLVSRIRRIKGCRRFDRSMRGDLDHALSVATYQVHISQLGRWSILPIGMLILPGIWEGGKSIWLAVAMVIFFILVSYAGRWEHNIYKAKKRELEILQSKLKNEELSDNAS